MNKLDNLEIVISVTPEFEEQSTLNGELRLIRSFLPEILKEISTQPETNKE